MTALIHHLASLARLSFARLPLRIETGLSPAPMRLRLGSLPIACGLALTWLGPYRFLVQTLAGTLPFRRAPIVPTIQLRIVGRDRSASLEGSAALPAFPRAVLLVSLLACSLLAIMVFTGRIATDHPAQALPVLGLTLSILEVVHIAVLRAVRRTLGQLAAVLEPGDFSSLSWKVDLVGPDQSGGPSRASIDDGWG